MEQNTTTIISFTAFLFSLATAVITGINHKRIRSTCCKRELIASIDIENTTPVDANNKRDIPT